MWFSQKWQVYSLTTHPLRTILRTVKKVTLKESTVDKLYQWEIQLNN
jgi:hypothetical protein